MIMLSVVLATLKTTNYTFWKSVEIENKKNLKHRPIFKKPILDLRIGSKLRIAGMPAEHLFSLEPSRETNARLAFLRFWTWIQSSNPELVFLIWVIVCSKYRDTYTKYEEFVNYAVKKIFYITITSTVFTTII